MTKTETGIATAARRTTADAQLLYALDGDGELAWWHSRPAGESAGTLPDGSPSDRTVSEITGFRDTRRTPAAATWIQPLIGRSAQPKE